jgi:hypothetical protein
VTYRHPDRAREELKRQLQPTPQCIPIERFGDRLTDVERDHLSVCARCEAELALWHGFADSTPVPDENGAVQWVASEVHRRRAESGTGRSTTLTPNWLARFRTRTLIAVAASVLVALAVAYVAWDPEPRINEPPSAQSDYRTARLDVVGPLGDLETPPKELIWVAVNGAVRYDVRVFEIDGTTLWKASSSVARVGLPAAVVAQFVPGKPIVWEVTARDIAGASLAVSGTQRFRVLGDAASRRQ